MYNINIIKFYELQYSLCICYSVKNISLFIFIKIFINAAKHLV